MKEELVFESHGMSREDVAKTFAAYLAGPLAFMKKNLDGSDPYGPIRKIEGDDRRWQLDNTGNNFFLHFESDGSARLNHRYEYGYEICLTMIKLFNLQYGRRKARAAA